MRRYPIVIAAAAAVAVVASVAAAVTSCSQTPTNVPVRTFQQATKMDVVCLHVNDENGNPLPAAKIQPVDRDTCSIVAPGSNGAIPQYHLYAVVIQSTPGELGVVDMTNGNVVDEDHSTPGINFIPVGAVPTDVAVPRAGEMTFVSSADPDKPAIYAIDNRRVLGDSTGANPQRPLTITDLPSCSLPQPPGALAIVQTSPTSYVVLAQLRTWGHDSARIVAIDPGPLMRGAGIDAGAPSKDGGTDGGSDGGVVAPGSLAPCPMVGTLTLSGTLPPSWTPAPAWPDGVPYVDGGVDLADAEPPPVPPGAQCINDTNLPDGGIPLTTPLGSQGPSPSAMTMRTDKPILYVADGALPMIHVIEVSDPTHPVEDPPLLATSVRNPYKSIGVGALAVSPATHDGKVYLYATDTSDGTVMVFDVTDPASTVRTPLTRPHPELNPFQPLDRIAFSAPVVSVVFAEHDWLLSSQADNNHTYTGILCNPNQNAHPNATTFNNKGAYYRVDLAGNIESSGTVESFPGRLRGIFAFATLSNGNVVVVDVDDWDAPCRRPDPMGPTYIMGLLDVPQQKPGAGDLDPYHTQQAYNPTPTLSSNAAVTLEDFFPVTAPHRIRSDFLLVNDPNGGNHLPNLVSTPTLTDSTGATIQTGAQNPAAPLIVPTTLPGGWVDPSLLQNPMEPDPSPTIRTFATVPPGTPGVRISFDDPTAHIDQNWGVTYEGVLPNAQNLVADAITTDGYQSLTLTSGIQVDASAPANGLGTPGYCAMGIEDWTLGQARAEAVQKGNKADAWTSDYVEITDDLLGEGDPYWSQPGNDCWDGLGASVQDDNGTVSSTVAANRYNLCTQRFGEEGEDASASGVGIVADTYLARDFPIIHAYDDHLVLGRFGWQPGQPELTTNRVIVGPDPSNTDFLKVARCCFHHQVTYEVRTGGEWVTVGQSGIGLLHHVRTSGNGSCILSCDPADALLNSRLLDTPATFIPKGGTCPTMGGDGGPGSAPQVDRNSFMAMRNPMFSFAMKGGCGEQVNDAHTLTTRDMQWHFALQGGFTPLSMSITQGSNVSVSPQSSYFVEPISQLAIIDGEQQGLVVFDLYTLQFAEGPFY